MPILGAIFSFAANIPKHLTLFNFFREHMHEVSSSKDVKSATSGQQMNVD